MAGMIHVHVQLYSNFDKRRHGITATEVHEVSTYYLAVQVLPRIVKAIAQFQEAGTFYIYVNTFKVHYMYLPNTIFSNSGNSDFVFSYRGW